MQRFLDNLEHWDYNAYRKLYNDVQGERNVNKLLEHALTVGVPENRVFTFDPNVWFPKSVIKKCKALIEINVKAYDDTEKIIIVDCMYGLGNRLRALASAYSISVCKGMKLIINWINDVHCNIKIDDLFVNIQDIASVVYEKIPVSPYFKYYNYIETEKNGKKNEFVDVDLYSKIHVRTNCVINSKYSKKHIFDFFNRVKITDLILDKLQDTSDCIGMHIRMEGGRDYQLLEADKGTNWTKDEMEKMYSARDGSHINKFIAEINRILLDNPEQKFYISTDLKINYDKLVNIYGEKHIIYNKRNQYDRSLEQQYSAIVDVLNLSKCKRFFGSYWSSFSELVTYFQTENIRKHNFFSNNFKVNKMENISICYACKNRHDNILESIKTVINHPKIDDIVVVDWNTDMVNLYDVLLKNFSKTFWKINYIKITNSVPWILSYAYNISFIHAKNDKIIKSDCDYLFNSSFISELYSSDLNNQFYSFDHNYALNDNQKHNNGFFYLSRASLYNASFFNKNILFYGYDDDDLKNKFICSGITYNRLPYYEEHINVQHIPSSDEERVINSLNINNINFFGYDIANFNLPGPLVLYNKLLCDKLKNQNTRECHILDMLKLQYCKHHYIEYYVELNNIKLNDNVCNFLYIGKTVCEYDIFNSMKSYGYWLSDINNHYGNIISNLQNKYNITEIKQSINLFMFFVGHNNTKSKGNNHLVISLYNESKISRCIELLYCLRQNLNNDHISKIHILLETSKKDNYFISDCINLLKNEKIKVTLFNRRPLFDDYFDYCNKHIHGTAIIANSDIVYNKTLEHVNHIQQCEFYVLTRYQKYGDKFKLIHFSEDIEPPENKNIFNKINIFSQDTWIFKSPMEYKLDIPLFVGSMFSDSFINYRLLNSSYKVYNKSYFIESYHVQCDTSLSESFTKTQQQNEWKKLHMKINYETTNFLCGVPLQKLNGVQEDIIDWDTFWHIKDHYLLI